ncbi:hypothetical protein E2320_021639, partial [Naja naja]
MNGKAEKTNQMLQQYLRGYSTCIEGNWPSLLSLEEFSYNNALHTLITMIPFQAQHGRHPRAKWQKHTVFDSVEGVPRIQMWMRICQ